MRDTSPKPITAKVPERWFERDVPFFLLIFCLVTCVTCLPILLHPTRHLASLPIGDKGTNIWNLWWVYYAIFTRGISPLRCDLIFIPWGCDLHYHTLSLANGLLASPLTAFFGPGVAYNILFVCWTACTGCFAALWARQIGAHKPTAVLIGFMAAFGPFRWGHQNHLNLFSTPWLFLSFYLCERSVQQTNMRLIGSLTLSWILALFSDWYYGLFVGFYLVFRSLFLLLEQRDMKWFFWFCRTILLPFSCACLLIFTYFYSSWTSPKYIDSVDMKYSAFWSMDVMHFLVPIWYLQKFPQLQQNPEFFHHPGMLMMLVSVIFIIWGWSHLKNSWGVRSVSSITIVFLLFSLGPILTWNGGAATLWGVPILLPASVFELIPSLTVIRVYARFAYLGWIGVLLLGLLGMQHWLMSKRLNRWMIPLCLLLGSVFLVETKWTFPAMYSYTPSMQFSQESQEAVLELPFTPSSLSGLHLYHQTLHHHPIFVAEFSRLGHYKSSYLSSFPALTVLNDAALGTDPTVAKDFDQRSFCNELRRLGAVHIVLSSSQTLPQENARVQQLVNKVIQSCKGQMGLQE